MNRRIWQSLLGSAHWQIHKILVEAMKNWDAASIMVELAEQNNMSDVRGTTIDGWFPLNYGTISRRMWMPPGRVRTTMNDLHERDLYFSKRVGVPPKTYYKLNDSAIETLLEGVFLSEDKKTSMAAQTMDNPSFKHTGNSSFIKTKESFKTKKDNAKALCTAVPVVARPTLIKRNKTLQKQVVKSPFKNENIAEVFHHYCTKDCLPSHKVDPDSKTFQQCQKYIAKALRNHSKPVIKQAIDDYCLMLTGAGFKLSPKYDKISLPNFFLFDEHKERSHRNSIDKSYVDVTSWFDECVMGLPYLIKKFGNGMSEIDLNPKVTAALIEQYNKKQKNVMGGMNSVAADEKYFIKAAKIVVEFHTRHKDKINWSSQLSSSRNAAFFAPMMIDARFHFSQDNVTLVKPTWFSSDKALTFLIDYLAAKGMIDRSSKQQILDNKVSNSNDELIRIKNNERYLENKRKKRAARVAEEQD